MKALIQKYIQTGTVIAVCCMAILGTVCLGQMCCLTISKACVVSSDQLSIHFEILDAHCLTSINPGMIAGRCTRGVGDVCCRLDGCELSIPSAYIHSTQTVHFYSLQRTPAILDVDRGEKKTLQASRLHLPLKTLPIYLITQSIIC